MEDQKPLSNIEFARWDLNMKPRCPAAALHQGGGYLSEALFQLFELHRRAFTRLSHPLGSVADSSSSSTGQVPFAFLLEEEKNLTVAALLRAAAVNKVLLVSEKF